MSKKMAGENKKRIASVTRKKPNSDCKTRMYDLIAMHGPVNRSIVMQKLVQFARDEREAALDSLVRAKKVMTTKVEPTGKGRGRKPEVFSLAA